MVLFFLFLPFGYFYFVLPSEDQLVPGKNLSRIFRNLKDDSRTIISNRSAYADSMVCLSCVPYESNSDSCLNMTSSFIAKNIVTQRGSMLLWHLENAYQAKAIKSKYSAEYINNIYFSILSSIFKEPEIASLCTRFFSKPCVQLTLQASFMSGCYPPRAIDVENFKGCFK